MGRFSHVVCHEDDRFTEALKNRFQIVLELVGGWSGLTPVWDDERSTLLLLIGSNPVVSHGHSNAVPDPVSRLRLVRLHGREAGEGVLAADPRWQVAVAAARELVERPALRLEGERQV